MARSSVTRLHRLAHFAFAAVVLAGIMAVPSVATAQWRGPYPWGPWGPYSPYDYRFGQFSASVRLQVSPRTTEVYVDGYLAGIVDDYDGVFQRLRLQPGDHDIVLYLPGHRTVHHALYLNPGADQRIRHVMEPLASGERSEAPPLPEPRTRGPEPRVRPRPEPPSPPVPRTGPPERAAFGTLALRVQPPDAEILVDGERWTAPAEQDIFAIHLPEGRHHLEIRKQGFAEFSEDVLIRANRTLALNVSLKRL